MTKNNKPIRKTELSESIASIIKDILEVDLVEYDIPFIELGLESLDIPFFIKRLSKKFHVDIPVTSVFENTTIYSYAEYIHSKLGETQEKRKNKRKRTNK